MNKPIYHNREEARRGPALQMDGRVTRKFDAQELRSLPADLIRKEKLRAKELMRSLLMKLED